MCVISKHKLVDGGVEPHGFDTDITGNMRGKEFPNLQMPQVTKHIVGLGFVACSLETHEALKSFGHHLVQKLFHKNCMTKQFAVHGNPNSFYAMNLVGQLACEVSWDVGFWCPGNC